MQRSAFQCSAAQLQGAAPLVYPLWAAGRRGGGGPSAHPGSAGTADTGEAGWVAAGSVNETPPASSLASGVGLSSPTMGQDKEKGPGVLVVGAPG